MLTAYKRCHWFNSDFHSGFVLNDNQKISEISFDVNPFQINVNNNIKVITYVRDATQSKPIQIKLKEPYNQSREVFNDDNEGFPIIYTNHTGTEGMNNYYPYSVARLIPQQIPRFTFRVDDDYNKFNYNYYFTSVTNGTLLQIDNNPNAKYIVFRSNGSFVLNKNLNCDILVVGGGGGGGSRHAGGGGAGALIYLTNQNLILGSYTITIGAGGSGGINNANGANGNDTSISLGGINLYLAKGGGGGNGTNSAGLAGGSSGGSAGDDTTNTAAVSTNIPTGTYGNAGGGGSRADISNGYGGGGGGGAGSNGGNSIKDINNNATAGSGGIGRLISITGNGIYYAGGGGGGVNINGNAAGIGGLGGGGDGSKGAITANSGIANTGGGGGGGGFNGGTNGNGGAGGSGIVIIRFNESRIEGITPESTLIQATNTNIPITIDSQYQINYQTPVVLPKGTYSATFGNGAISLKSSKSYPILNTNPLVWYKFDDQGNLGLDNSGIHNLSNPNGVAFSTDSISGIGSASFDGTNDHLIKDGSFNLNSKSWSISVWVKKTNNSRQDWLFELGTGYSPQTTLTCGYKADNTISIANYNDDLNTTSTYNDAGTWTHLCFTFLTGTKQVTIYRNGVQIGQKNFTNEFNTNSNFRIAKQSTLYYQGLMDDFRIYQDKVLTPVEIYDLYNGNADRSYPILKDANGVTINPRNWYRFDNGNILHDNGSSPINLTAINITPIANTSNFVKGDSSCLNTTNITTPNYLRAGVNLTPPFSISFWLNMNSVVDNAFIGLATNTSGSSALISCQFSTSDNKITSYICAPVLWTIVSPSVTITSSTWYHYVLTITSGNPASCIAYINGALTGSQNGTGAFVDNNGVNQLFINIRGDLYAGSNFGGCIDDFRIYSQVLTATQVAELYNGRLAIYNPPAFILGTEIEPEAE